jgi:predicted protein tyrosine phosphatase
MNNSANSKRLDKIEIQLTPKQCAIRLADEMTRYASEEDFNKAIAKGTYWQSPYIKPFYALSEQAKERCPEDNCGEVKRRDELRTEFLGLKLLIFQVNNEMLIKWGSNRLMVALQASKLRTLMLEGVFADIGAVEMLSATSASEAQRHLSSRLEDWAEDSATLLMKMTAYKAAVQTIQERYFESHPILFKDVETEYEISIGLIRVGIAAFNEYRKDMAHLLTRELDQEQQKAGTANPIPFERKSSLPIDIEAIEKRGKTLVNSIVEKWTMNAKFKAKADVLRETGKHEDFVWQYFQKEVGLKS